MAQIFKVKTFSQLYNAMKNYLIGKSSTLNNFNSGTRINTILEAVALTSAKDQEDFYQGLKRAIPVAIYNGFGFTKLEGIGPVGTIRFARQTAAVEQYIIPIGTSILLNGIRYTTIQSGTIEIGSLESGDIQARSELKNKSSEIGIGAIDTLSGFGSFINQPNGINSAYNYDSFAGGVDPETDQERQTRFINYINGLTKSTLSGIYAGVRTVSGIKSVTVIENYPEDGWITIYADDGTGQLTTEKKNEILKVIRGDENDFENFPGYKSAGIYVQVLEPVINQIDIVAELKMINSSDLTDAEMKIIGESAMQLYTNSLLLGADWVKSEAVTAVQNADKDVYDFVISSPSPDIVSIADNQLAKTNNIDITITRVTP